MLVYKPKQHFLFYFASTH